MTLAGYRLATIHEFIGRELGISDWLTIDQDRIDQFAACTDDRQWIHVDVDRARRESPFGITIAHGYLTLALVARFGYEIGVLPADVSQAFNYGVERARFLAPVKAGSRVRARVELLGAEKKEAGRVLLTLRYTIEIEGESRPAMIAEILALLLPQS
jgi:acyl dehydratase